MAEIIIVHFICPMVDTASFFRIYTFLTWYFNQWNGGQNVSELTLIGVQHSNKMQKEGEYYKFVPSLSKLIAFVVCPFLFFDLENFNLFSWISISIARSFLPKTQSL